MKRQVLKTTVRIQDCKGHNVLGRGGGGAPYPLDVMICDCDQLEFWLYESSNWVLPNKKLGKDNSHVSPIGKKATFGAGHHRR